MSRDFYAETYAALQHALDLIGEQADWLEQSQEDPSPLRKMRALVEQFAEQFKRRQILAQISQAKVDGWGKETITTTKVLDEYEKLTKILAEYYNPPPAKKNATPPKIVESEGGEELYPNGINVITGNALISVRAGDIVAMIKNKDLKPLDTSTQNAYKSKVASFCIKEDFTPSGEESLGAVESAKELVGDIRHYGVVSDVNQNNISEARWAVVVRAQEDIEVLKALWPLIEHRMGQMGFKKRDFDFQSGDTTCGAWLSRHTDGGKKTLANAWGEIPPVLLVRANEDVNMWLGRHKVHQAPVDPALGVPFYLMIVGRPGKLNESDDVFIPWDFQYELDVFWGVGRVVFTTANGQHRLDAYRAYAEQVVDWEQRADAANRLKKEIAFFGTRHEGDQSTISSADELIKPLGEWAKAPGKIPAKQGVGHTLAFADEATRNNLGRLLTASTPPALLFTATHGAGLPPDDPALVMQQGALITADFEFGKPKRDHWFAGEDLDALSNLNVQGMIACLFACYGAGCPQQDEFVFEPGKPRKQIAPFSFVAQLPQRMLAKGALAVLGHVERAWTYSFNGIEGGADKQIQPFQDVLGRLLQGMPAGSATDQFNVVQGARSLTLTQQLEHVNNGWAVDNRRLARLWMARNDARNYVLLGDPAVKLAL